MNKKQWLILGIGLFIFGIFLRSLAPFCASYSGDILTSCLIQRYSLSIPGLFSIALGILFTIIANFEKK